MRIFSKSLSYTLKAIIYLANNSEGRLTLAAEIAKEEKIPYHYLSKLLQQLTKFRIVDSTKGRNGGFKITNKGLNSTVSTIIELIDGPGSKLECILHKSECPRRKPCALHKYWDKTRNDIHNSLNMKIKDLIIKK